MPGTFGWLLVWWIALAATLWYAAFAVALATMRSALWAALWMLALLLVVSLGNEAPFIAVVALFTGLSIAAGHTSAMSLSPEAAYARVTLIAAAVTLVLVIMLERGTGRRFPVMAAGFGVTLRVAFKAGFLRQDEWHTPISLLAVAVVALVSLPLFWAAASPLTGRRQAAPR